MLKYVKEIMFFGGGGACLEGHTAWFLRVVLTLNLYLASFLVVHGGPDLWYQRENLSLLPPIPPPLYYCQLFNLHHL